MDIISDILLNSLSILIKDNPDTHLLIVGGRQEQIDEYRRQAVQLRLENCVTFTGMVSPADIPSFTQCADVIASPRCSGTNTPLKIYGYMRTGRAIVATDLPTHTQTLDHSIAHLVAPTPEAFAQGLKYVLDNREFREALAQRARRHVEDNFSDADYVNKVNLFYASVLRRRNLAPQAPESAAESSVR